MGDAYSYYNSPMIETRAEDMFLRRRVCHGRIRESIRRVDAMARTVAAATEFLETRLLEYATNCSEAGVDASALKRASTRLMEARRLLDEALRLLGEAEKP